MFRFLPLILFLLAGISPLTAQSSHRADSLKTVLRSRQPDTLKAGACVELAILYRQTGELDSAFAYAEKGLQLSRKVHYRRGEAKALYNQGILVSSRGNYTGALEKLSEAIAIDSVLDRKAYASELSAMGGQKMLLGDLPEALEYHLQALKIKEALGDSAAISSAVSNIGVVYHSAGEQDKALAYFKRSLRLNLKYGKLSRAVTDYYNIGNVLHEQKKFPEALSYLAESGRLADSLGDEESLMYAYNVIGSIRNRQGQWAEAIADFNKALVIAEKREDLRMIGYLCQNLGETYYALHDYPKAEANFLRGLVLADSIRSKELRRNLCSSLSSFYEEQGDNGKALAFYKAFIAARDSLIDEEKGKEMMRKEMNFDFEKKRALADAEQKKKDALTAEDKKRKLIIIYAGAAILLLALIFLLFVYNRFRVSQKQKAIITAQKSEVEQQRDQVEKQKAVIEEKNKSITDSINYAQRIQQAILPPAGDLQKHFPGSFIFFRPRDIVSGDFYWFAEKNGKRLVAAVDCTGHGVPGAFMSMIGNAFLQEIVNGKGITRPAEILSELRFLVIDALKQKGETGEQRDGMDISLCCLYEEGDARKLEWAGANNPLWIIRNKECIEVQPDKRSIGFFRGKGLPFTNNVIDLQPGDTLYIFTDGFADQFGGPKGKKFKYRPFQELLASIAGLPAEQQSERLAVVFDEWKGSLEQVDDVLLIGIRIK